MHTPDWLESEAVRISLVYPCCSQYADAGLGKVDIVGTGVASGGDVGSAAWGVTPTQPVTIIDIRTNINLNFIFDPFNVDDGDVEVPQLFQKAT
jgi:hypothetical protein